MVVLSLPDIYRYTLNYMKVFVLSVTSIFDVVNSNKLSPSCIVQNNFLINT